MANSKQWRMINRLRTPFDKRYNRLFRVILNKQIIPVMESIDTFGVQTTIDKMEFLIPVDPVAKGFKALYSEVGVKFAVVTSNGIKGSAEAIETKQGEDEWLLFMQRFALTEAAGRVSSIVETSRKEAIRIIQEQIEVGITEGLGIPEISRRIEKTVPQAWRVTNKFRAQRIAQTEIISASNAGSLSGATSTGLPLNKIWLTGGANIRDTHMAADGESVPKGDKFINTGEPMDFPGDLAGSPENVINCKCAIAYETVTI